MSVTIAIVGRPNVGKSRLYNALLKRRSAIVHDQPGVTRDPNTGDLAPGLTLVDTGGWGLGQIKGLEAEAKALAEAVEEQVDVAIQAAQKILFVVDGRAGVAALDSQIAQHLRPYKDIVTLIINKIDEDGVVFDEGEFLQMGFSSWQVISAEHGRGIEGLRNSLLKMAPVVPPAPAVGRRPSVCIVGRPNVGKSSLTNALLKTPKMIVSPISGTTRDPVAFDLDYTGKKGDTYQLRLIDTAGLRHRTKVGSPVEVFSQIKTREAIEKADIAVLVVDALDGITGQDQQLCGDIQKLGKPLVIAVNKWDLASEQFTSEQTIEGYETLQDFENACRENIEASLFFTAGAPMVFLSAKNEINLEGLLKFAKSVEGKQDLHMSTPEINKALMKLMWRNVPRNSTGKIFRVYYATQTSNRPYRLKLFCNQSSGINDAYKRYLAKGFAEAFDVGGCPFFFDFVSKPKRELTNRPVRALKPRQKLRLSRNKKTKRHGKPSGNKRPGQNKSRS